MTQLERPKRRTSIPPTRWSEPLRGALRVLRRGTRLCVHLLWGVLLTLWLRGRHGTDWFRLPYGQARRRQWQRALASILGLRVHAAGTPMSAAGLLVANHISWLDIVAIASAVPTTFVAKDDVRAWPLIGPLAHWGGTVFLRRARVSVLTATIDTLADTIAQGQRVTVFPEGTTTTGTVLGTFHRALFEAAVKSGAPVQAIAVRYRREGRPDTIAPFVGDDAFVPHLLRVMAAPRTEVHLEFQPAVSGDNRRTLAIHTHAQIRAALAEVLVSTQDDDASLDRTASADDAAELVISPVLR